MIYLVYTALGTSKPYFYRNHFQTQSALSIALVKALDILRCQIDCSRGFLCIFHCQQRDFASMPYRLRCYLHCCTQKLVLLYLNQLSVWNVCELWMFLTSFSYLVGFQSVWGIGKAEKEVGKERGTLYESDAPVPTFNSTIQIWWAICDWICASYMSDQSFCLAMFIMICLIKWLFKKIIK